VEATPERRRGQNETHIQGVVARELAVFDGEPGSTLSEDRHVFLHGAQQSQSTRDDTLQSGLPADWL
jgi:hypothetical protein